MYRRRAPGGPAPASAWHAQLQRSVYNAEHALNDLVAVCEVPAARAAVEARDNEWADTANAAQLEAALRSAELILERTQRVRDALAQHAPAAPSPTLAQLPADGTAGFPCVPHAVALQIFALLPADARARCAVVCRAWRVFVADPNLWLRLDVSSASGMRRPVADAKLFGAAARAGGQLAALNLSDTPKLTVEAQQGVVTANGASLRELRCTSEDESELLNFTVLQQLALAAPGLQNFHADTWALLSRHISAGDVTLMLRNEPPFGAVRLRALWVEQDMAAIDNATQLEQLGAAIAGHASLQRLYFEKFAALGALKVVDALSAGALASQLRVFRAIGCALSAASVPAIAQLIRGGVLTALTISNGNLPLFDVPAAALFADAVACSSALTSLELSWIRLWHDVGAAAAVVRSLTAHPSLHDVSLKGNHLHRDADPEVAGDMLGALVAANAPALQRLDVSNTYVGDDGMAPLCDAFALNTHLNHLDVTDTQMSADFLRRRFLPALKANRSLRSLQAVDPPDDEDYYHHSGSEYDLLGDAEYAVNNRSDEDDE